MRHILEIWGIGLGAIFGWEVSKRWTGARSWSTIWIGVRQGAWGFVWVLLWKPDEIESVRIYETNDDGEL